MNVYWNLCRGRERTAGLMLNLKPLIASNLDSISGRSTPSYLISVRSPVKVFVFRLSTNCRAVKAGRTRPDADKRSCIPVKAAAKFRLFRYLFMIDFPPISNSASLL